MANAEAAAGPMDAIVALALGALGRMRELDGWVEAAIRAAPGHRLEPDDPALLAVLGLISLRRTTGRWLDEAMAETEDEREADGVDGEAVTPTGLLR